MKYRNTNEFMWESIIIPYLCDARMGQRRKTLELLEPRWLRAWMLRNSFQDYMQYILKRLMFVSYENGIDAIQLFSNGCGFLKKNSELLDVMGKKSQNVKVEFVILTGLISFSVIATPISLSACLSLHLSVWCTKMWDWRSVFGDKSTRERAMLATFAFVQ